MEFIYTGNVEITDEDNAQRLIEMADFLILPPLKALAESYLVTNLKLDISNSISIYVFAGRFRCEKLISHAINFIGANFTIVVKAKEFLDLSREEFKICISSNKINVSTEEDVFEILLTWINHDKCERKQYFEELFREIKLVYLSRDFLESDVITNDFVKVFVSKHRYAMRAERMTIASFRYIKIQLDSEAKRTQTKEIFKQLTIIHRSGGE